MTKNIVLSVIYTGIVLFISIVSIQRPDYNWDTLTYVASVYTLESQDTNSIHKNTYDAVKNTVPPQSYELLTTNNKYREEMLLCAKCFYQQLPFYRIRPLYVILIYILYKLGLNIVISPFVISSLSCFLVSLMCFFWLNLVCRDKVLVFIVSVLLAMSPFLLSSATEASSNSLSGFIILGAFYSFARRKFVLSLGLILLSVFARPDNLLLVILFSFALILYKGDDIIVKKTFIIITVILGILFFLVINKWSGNYNWSVWFEHTFKDRIITPAEYDAQFSLYNYLRSFSKWAILFKYTNFALQMIIFVSILYLKSIPIKELRNNMELMMVMIAVSSILLHYLIYPVIEDKYFISQYLVIDIIFIKNVIEKSKFGLSKIFTN